MRVLADVLGETTGVSSSMKRCATLHEVTTSYYRSVVMFNQVLRWINVPCVRVAVDAWCTCALRLGRPRGLRLLFINAFSARANSSTHPQLEKNLLV